MIAYSIAPTRIGQSRPNDCFDFVSPSFGELDEKVAHAQPHVGLDLRGPEHEVLELIS